MGIIGGSGLYEIDGLTDIALVDVDTPWGRPSDKLLRGKLGGVPVVFLPRHARGHRLLPHELPYAANIVALKRLGVTHVLSVSAVGSMREELHPGHVVLVDQYLDRTWGRPVTLFGGGIAAHVSLADPTCAPLRQLVGEVATAAGATVHQGGTYVCIQGPAFSTRAESESYRQLGVHVIGMTAMPEARLAREAQLHYTTLALVTDYDCWHATEEAVSADAVIEVLHKNTARVKQIIAQVVPRLGQQSVAAPCPCPTAMRGAIITAQAAQTPLLRARYADVWPAD